MRWTTDGMSGRKNFGNNNRKREEIGRSEVKREKIEDIISMVIRNIAGLTEKEVKNWASIKRFDIIGITESWITKEKEGYVRKNFQDCEVTTTEARK